MPGRYIDAVIAKAQRAMMMTVVGLGYFTWTNSIWNFAKKGRMHEGQGTGCDNCYASALVSNPRYNFTHKFEDVQIHPNRLAHVGRF